MIRYKAHVRVYDHESVKHHIHLQDSCAIIFIFESNKRTKSPSLFKTVLLVQSTSSSEVNWYLPANNLISEFVELLGLVSQLIYPNFYLSNNLTSVST